MPDDWVELDFNGVLSTLQAWLGRIVSVSVETGQPDRPLGLAHATGTLRASDMFDPRGYDEDEYAFDLHPPDAPRRGFALDRDWFHNAVLTREGKLLIITMGAPKDDPTTAPQLYIADHGQA